MSVPPTVLRTWPHYLTRHAHNEHMWLSRACSSDPAIHRLMITNGPSVAVVSIWDQHLLAPARSSYMGLTAHAATNRLWQTRSCRAYVTPRLQQACSGGVKYVLPLYAGVDVL